jgi:O-antigen/teichoic acid export membrane protein
MTGQSRTAQVVRGGSAVAVAIGIMNVATYAYQMIAARLLGPHDYGAFAALMNLVMVVNVLALALQANAARRIAAEPGDVHAVEASLRRVGRQAAVLLGLLSLLMAPVINAVLRLDSLGSALLIGVTTVPLSLMGYQAGVLQGERRWQALGLVYLAIGVPRLALGTLFVVLDPTPFWAMFGVMVAAWFPVAVGAWALRRPREAEAHREPRQPHTDRDLWRETLRNSHALLAYFALSNADVVIARNVMDGRDAGLYAAGLIMTKAVLFLPQFVVVLAFPSMGQSQTQRRTLLGSLGAVAAISALVAAVTSVLSGLAMVFVGGRQYSEIQGSLWVFALLGGVLAMLQLLVYSVLARQSERSVYLVWAALAAVVALGSTADTFSSLLLLVLAVDVALFGVLLAVSLWRVRGAPRTSEEPLADVGVPGGA